MGCGPWGGKESGTTKRLTLHFTSVDAGMTRDKGCGVPARSHCSGHILFLPSSQLPVFIIVPTFHILFHKHFSNPQVLTKVGFKYICF